MDVCSSGTLHRTVFKHFKATFFNTVPFYLFIYFKQQAVTICHDKSNAVCYSLLEELVPT